MASNNFLCGGMTSDFVVVTKYLVFSVPKTASRKGCQDTLYIINDTKEVDVDVAPNTRKWQTYFRSSNPGIIYFNKKNNFMFRYELS